MRPGHLQERLMHAQLDMIIGQLEFEVNIIDAAEDLLSQANGSDRQLFSNCLEFRR